MGSPKEFYLLAIGAHALDESVHLIRFTASLTYLRNDNIAIQGSHYRWVSLDAHQAMLLAVVQPMTSAASTNNPLHRIDLDPHQLLNTPVTPKLQALAAQLHSSTSHPKKNDSSLEDGLYPSS
jgi:hypothetical protein